MKKIKLTKGKFAIIDDEDFELVSQYSWQVCPASSDKLRAKTIVRGKNLYMHRLILGDREGLFIDHINRDPLDNRRKNLRYCTTSQNLMNRGVQKNNTTGYKGVVFDRRGRKNWFAKIRFQYKVFYLGYHSTAEEAAIAYNKKAKELHGEFAYQNII